MCGHYLQFLFVVALIVTALGHPLETHDEVLESQRYYEKGDFFEGDMRYAEDIFVRTGILAAIRRWPNNTVYYEINSTFTNAERDIIFSGLNEIQANTCIKFLQRTNETNYIHVQSLDTGCWSYVGRLSGKQNLNLETPGCISKRTVMHEFMHALGFFHQHSASDRDDFIEILMDNVIENRQYNFNKYSSEIITDFGVGYDYLSVMHYSQFAFSKNGNRTIVTKDPEVQTIIGRVTDLSKKDMAKIRAMYDCPDSENAIR